MKDKNIQKINFIHISGQSYSSPKEVIGTNSSGQWLLRKIRVIIAANQWIDFVFEDIELWNKVKELPIGSFIEVNGRLKNEFSHKEHRDKPQIIVNKIIYVSTIKTSKKEKFIMSLETITKRNENKKKKEGK